MSYQSQIEADAPYAWYRMDAASGTLEADKGSGKHDAEYVNTGELGYKATGIPGAGPDTAMSFNAGAAHNARLQLPTTGSVSGTFSIELWANPTTLGNERELFASAVAVKIQVGELGQVLIELGNGETFLVGGETASGLVTANAWSHFVLTASEAGGFILYVNGEAALTNATESPGLLLWNATHAPRAGHGVGPNFFRGAIDELALYASALSATRVGAHYEAGKTAAALVAKTWAGPFTGLYRGQSILQGSQVEIPPQETVSTWFR